MPSLSFSRSNRTIIILSFIAIAAFMMLFTAIQSASACDVAVVSGKYTSDGRPLLWKNFDCSSAWNQEVKYFPAKSEAAGDYMLLYHNDDYMTIINGSPVMPQSGANKAGFACSVAAVYEDFDPLHEANNLNTDLVEDAVEQCGTLQDFESLLKTWPKSHLNHPISANFVAIDAKGGAALYECYTGTASLGLMYIQYRKYDANTGQVTDDKGNVILAASSSNPGFVNRTNLNNYVWYNSGVDRYLRAQDLLAALAVKDSSTGKTRLNAQALMQVVAKDVVGKQADDNGDTHYSTTYCISRNQTRSATVFQGVRAGDDPLKSVYWTALGEPSIAVFVPNMLGAGAVCDYAIMDKIDSNGVMQNKSDNSLLTIAEDKLEISAGIHTSNRGSVVNGPYNKYIDKTALANVQAWTFPLENTVVAKTNEFLTQLNRYPSLITQENLRAFTQYCGKFIYENYTARSAASAAWNFTLQDPDEDPAEEPGDDSNDGSNDPGADSGDPQAIDKSVLRALILGAQSNKAAANVSLVGGSDVITSEQWVSPAEMAAYNNAINAAIAVSLNTNVTQAQVDQAITDMKTADKAFQAAKEPGTMQGLTLNGKVYEKGGWLSLRKVVSGAEVYIIYQGKKYSTTTNKNGSYTLETEIPVGTTCTVYCVHPKRGTLSEIELMAIINYKDFVFYY